MATKRWTDEMLDKLADKVEGLTDKVDDLTDSIKEGKAMTDALLQIATLHQRKMDDIEKEMELTKQRQAENDARFNVLLEEIRYLIRHRDN